MADQNVSERNKEIVGKFLRDAALGKTIRGRARTKIGSSRLTNYISHLYHLMGYLDKDLDAVTQEDMEKFVEAIENDEIRSRSRRVMGNQIDVSGEPLSSRYKVDVKVTVKKFYKWLLGDCRQYPPLVEWIDTFSEPKDVPALSEMEVDRLVSLARTPEQRAIIQVLFDGGLRIGELLNVRLHHVTRRSLEVSGVTRHCFVIWIPFSKTLRRAVALPMSSTSKWIHLWLEYHPANPRIADDGRIEAEESQAPLFPVPASYVRSFLGKLGRTAIKKRVYPHLLRHSSATYWANKLPYFKFCKRFGWTMTSKMPQRYIDRQGVDELSVIELHLKDEGNKLHQEKEALLRELALLRAGKRA